MRALPPLVSLLLIAPLGLPGCAATTTPQSVSPRSPTATKKPPLPADIVERSALPLHGVVSENGATVQIDEQAVWRKLLSARVVCFGEQHNNPNHHYAEWRALQELAAHAAKEQRVLAVGFEMFQTPYQAPLSGFADGTLTEEQFLEETNYAKRWGYDFAFYRPLLEVAQQFKLPTLALNAPKAITRSIGRHGLASLSDEVRQGLPELDLNNPTHRKYFDDAMGDHPMPEGGPKRDDMYAAQVVWDETMANTSAKWLASQGDNASLIVFAGSGHCHHSAIPARITRRTQIPVLSVTPILSSKTSETPQAAALFDLQVVLED